MCILHLAPWEVRHLIRHYTLIGRDFEEVMRGRNKTLDVYPNRPAPVVVEQHGERIVRQDMLWGFPPFKPDAGYGTNFRSLKNHLWRPWLDREHRCVVPASAFSEPDKNTPKGAVVWRWFERADLSRFRSNVTSSANSKNRTTILSAITVEDHKSVPRRGFQASVRDRVSSSS